MAIYECGICGYVFDEQQASETFDNIYSCPICDADKSRFKRIDAEEPEENEEDEEEFIFEDADEDMNQETSFETNPFASVEKEEKAEEEPIKEDSPAEPDKIEIDDGDSVVRMDDTDVFEEKTTDYEKKPETLDFIDEILSENEAKDEFSAEEPAIENKINDEVTIEEPATDNEVKDELTVEEPAAENEVKEAEETKQESENVSSGGFVIEKRQEFWKKEEDVAEQEKTEEAPSYTLNRFGSVEKVIGKEENREENTEEKEEIKEEPVGNGMIQTFYSYSKPVKSEEELKAEEEAKNKDNQEFRPLWGSGMGTVQKIVGAPEPEKEEEEFIFEDSKEETLTENETEDDTAFIAFAGNETIAEPENDIVTETVNEEENFTSEEATESVEDTIAEDNEDIRDVMEDDAVEDTAPEETVSEEMTYEDTPAEEAVIEDTPVDEPVIEETSEEGTLFEEAFAEETVFEETPVEETVVDETPAEETVVEETPAEETLFEEASSEETVIEETPSEETVFEEATAEETLFEETPEEETVFEETPAEETLFEEAPVEETVFEEVPEEETVLEETPAEKTIFEEFASEEMAEEIPSEDISEDETNEEADDDVTEDIEETDRDYICLDQDETEEITDEPIAYSMLKSDMKYTVLYDSEAKKIFEDYPIVDENVSNGLENIILLPAQCNPLPLKRNAEVETKTVIGALTKCPVEVLQPFCFSKLFIWGEHIPNNTKPEEYANQALVLVKGEEGHIPNLSSKEELREEVAIAKARFHEAPVGIDLVAGRIEADLEACVYAKVDYVILNDVSSRILPYALRRARNYLNRVNSKLEILVCVDALKDAQELAKILALGANFVLVERGFDIEMANKMTEALKEICRSTGHSNVHDLNLEDICTVDMDLAMYTDISHV